MKTKSSKIVLFKDQKIRRDWNKKEQKWYFSVIDIVGVLSKSTSTQAYWRKLKERLKAEGSETVTKCHGLKMKAIDGKMRLTDVADTETMLRLIQSIPSPNAEPFKLWLARVGYERIEETEDPEKGIQRALSTYLKKGYSKSWVDLRLKSIEIRKDLTNEWDERGVSNSKEYAILTDDITFAWAGLRTKDYKDYKNLKKENLRDNMTNLELVLNMLAETATTEISKTKKPDTFYKNRIVAKEGGDIAGRARKQIEVKSGRKVISKYRFGEKRDKLLK
ncbi:MAG: BRO family protein [Patescibacteria group bacterium]